MHMTYLFRNKYSTMTLKYIDLQYLMMSCMIMYQKIIMSNGQDYDRAYYLINSIYQVAFFKSIFALHIRNYKLFTKHQDNISNEHLVLDGTPGPASNVLVE